MIGPKSSGRGRHLGQLKIRPGAQIAFAHRRRRTPPARARAEELVLPLAGHVRQQQGHASAGGKHIRAGGRRLQDLGEPFVDQMVHFLDGQFGGGALRFAWPTAAWRAPGPGRPIGPATPCCARARRGNNFRPWSRPRSIPPADGPPAGPERLCLAVALMAGSNDSSRSRSAFRRSFLSAHFRSTGSELPGLGSRWRTTRHVLSKLLRKTCAKVMEPLSPQLLTTAGDSSSPLSEGRSKSMTNWRCR